METVYLTVERYISKGMCWKCAILIAAELTCVDPERVEDVWILRSSGRVSNDVDTTQRL